MYDPKILDSRIQLEFEGAMTQIRHTLSPAMFDAAVLVIAARFEGFLRAKVPVDHPMLVRLDEHRANEKEWKAEALRAIALSRLRYAVYRPRPG